MLLRLSRLSGYITKTSGSPLISQTGALARAGGRLAKGLFNIGKGTGKFAIKHPGQAAAIGAAGYSAQHLGKKVRLAHRGLQAGVPAKQMMRM